jgi:UPF0271 protein
MGEGFGQYSLSNDSALMPMIDLANVACGFHASDPTIMRRTVRLGLQHGVAIGAHPSFPDLQGFGRREMRISRDDMTALLSYQIGALKAFLDQEGGRLSHIKPHGALYGMAMRDAETAGAIADVVAQFGVPVLGLAGTMQEQVYRDRGLIFVGEFYVDLEYDDEGRIIVGGKPKALKPEQAARRAMKALSEGTVVSASGKTVPVRAESLCVHSDSENAEQVLRALRACLSSPRAAMGG